jgi:cyclic-di-GMP-binding protein
LPWTRQKVYQFKCCGRARLVVLLTLTHKMAQFSFDVVSEYDKSEMNNVFDQSQREIANRYDFKGTPAELEWLNADKTGLKVTGNGDWQIDAILDIVRKKLAARGQSQKVLDTSREPVTSNLKTTKEVPFKQGLDQEKAKKITGLIRDNYPKIKTQIQGDAVRVVSGSKDDLQAVMQLLKSQDFDFPLSFTNYR